MTSVLDGDSLRRDISSIDDTDSPYTTSGEDILLVDTTNGTVTVTLSTSDATADPESQVTVWDVGDNASTNNITVDTEGSETIDPGDASSKTLQLDGIALTAQADGSNWFSKRHWPDVSAFAGAGLTALAGQLQTDYRVRSVSSNTTTSGSGIYLVDTSGGAVTLTLASTDASNEAAIGVVNISGSNDVTVDTESTETIDPGGVSSKTLSTAGWLVWFEGDGTNWDSSLAPDVESIKVGDGSSVSGLISAALTNGEIWADDGNIYTDMSDAEAAASSLLVIGPGTFTSDSDFGGNEALRIATANLRVVGAGRDTILDGGSNDGILVSSADGVVVENVAVKTTAGAGNAARALNTTSDANEGEFRSIYIEESDDAGMRVDGDEWRVVSVWCDSANIDGDDIRLGGNNNIADDIIGTVNDAGTGNSVGETA